jgi:glycosyltransferase involved in cell wall biosynthesis
MRVLTFSALYPNRAMPNFGVFVENRLRHLMGSGQVEARVVAPVPWFPSRHPIFGTYARWAQVPEHEIRHGLEVRHPRYALPPRIGTHLHPFLMAAGSLPALRALRREGFDFDLIDAHFYYPTGVAALLLGRLLDRPVVITARGSDINDAARRHPLVRRMIATAAQGAAASIAVSQGLAEQLCAAAPALDRVEVLRNGVDADLFRPVDRSRARQALGLKGPLLVSVGHLIERKGHHLAVQALRMLPDCHLAIVGDGPQRQVLAAVAQSAHVAERVYLLGEVAHDCLSQIYSAADVLVLASSREGWANVLLEAMACGTPVAAAPVEGVNELVTTPAAGRILTERSAPAIAEAVRAILADPPSREATRRHAEAFSWDATTAGQLDVFRSVLAGRGR